MQIIVLGAHRSGTSLVTRLINMMGAYFAIGESALGANIENPKGFWERWDVIEANDRILSQYDCSWDKLSGWSFKENLVKKDEKKLESVNKSIASIILELDANRPWVMKDPRMCLTFPFWKPQLELPVVVCVYRNPLEVARSLQTRNEFAFSHSMALWEYYATGITNAIRHVPTIFVSHQDMLRDPVATVKKLLDDLQEKEVQGLRMPGEKEITSFIDPTLYRSRDKKDALDDMVTDYQRRLMRYVSGEEDAPRNVQEPTEMAASIIGTLAEYRTMQAKLEDHFQRFATVEQERSELRNQLASYEENTDELRAEYEKRLEKAHADMAFLKDSSSWKVGRKIVGAARTLTFRKSESA